jgi:hypothetical protein
MRLPLTPTIVLSNGRLIGSRYMPNDAQEFFDLADPERCARLSKEELDEAMTAVRQFRSLKTTTELLNSHFPADVEQIRSCDNCGNPLADPDEILCEKCKKPSTPTDGADGTAGHNKADLITLDPYGYGDGDCSLISLAQTAPHDCGDPNCPGVINKHKLEHVRHLERQIELTQRLLTRQTELAQQVIEAFGLEFAADADPVVEILHLLAVTGHLAKQEQA